MRQCALRKLRPLRLSNAPSLELRSSYATQGLLDHFLGRRNDSGPGVTAVVGARRNRSDRLPLLVGGVPQRLVLIQVTGLQISGDGSTTRHHYRCHHASNNCFPSADQAKSKIRLDVNLGTALALQTLRETNWIRRRSRRRSYAARRETHNAAR